MPARAAAAGRPRAPVPARLAPPAAARTRAQPPPAARAQSARREHDFCLQAGFPPGHDGRGPPASSRQNVSVSPRGTRGSSPHALGRAAAPSSPSRSPEEGESGRAALLRPANAAAARDRPPPLGFGGGAGRGEPGECPDVPSGAGIGVGVGTGVGAGTGRLGVGARRGPASGDRRAGDQVRTGEPDAGSGGPAGGDRRAGRGVPGRGVRVPARVI